MKRKRKRMENSGLPEAEVERLAREIFSMMEQAHQDQPITSSTGKVKPMALMTWDGEDEVFGIWRWEWCETQRWLPILRRDAAVRVVRPPARWHAIALPQSGVGATAV